MNIGIVGAGYVGLTTGICLATLKHKIMIYDKDLKKIAKIKNKNMPFYEQGLQNLLEETISNGCLCTTENINELVKNTDGCFICVGTPANENNSIDLTQVMDATYSLAQSIENNKKSNYVIILRSTVIPTTTTQKIFPYLKEKLSQPFGLCVVPEFLREGQALEDFMNPDKIVIGSVDEKSKIFVEKIFEYFNNAVLIPTNLETAELIKYTNNSFFSMLISFSNEIANIAETISGVDPFNVLKALISDKRITSNFNGTKIVPSLGAYLIPGCGFGGSCFPKDVKAILSYAASKKIKTPILNAVIEINDERPQKIVSLAKSILGSLQDKQISILGLTFKPDTDDMRSSPALEAIKLFQAKRAKIFAYDPMIRHDFVSDNKFLNFNLCKSIEECLTHSELAIIFTKWQEFKSIDSNLLKMHMKNPVLIDGRGFLDENKFEKNCYYKIGYVE